MEQIGKASGGSIEYIDPDSEAEAIYIYPNKEVLRYPNKGFRQRQRDTDGQYVWNVKGVPSKLYSGNNHDPMHYEDHLQKAQTVIMVEGEKDADTVTNLQLMNGTATNRVIGVTSGSASSWEPVLAKELKDKRLIILPDDDAAGIAYANEIEQSLKDEGITDYRRVSFAGTGCKDVSDYMQSHNEDDLIRLIGIDWLRKQNGYDVDDTNTVIISSTEDTLIQI
jgi:5S rRNA maturation endonuclease (ribonuclease M5)